MFDSPTKLLLGFVTGLAFGLLLQKGRVAKFEVIIGQFLFKDWTVVKVMGTAVVIGAIGVYALVSAEMASLHIKPLEYGGLLAGAVCFGIGMALFGYCPGTSLAACGEGRKDAMIGVLGMFAGAIGFVAFYPASKAVMTALGDGGKVTWASMTETSPWVWVLSLAVAGAAAALLFDRRLRSGRHLPGSTEQPQQLSR